MLKIPLYCLKNCSDLKPKCVQYIAKTKELLVQEHKNDAPSLSGHWLSFNLNVYMSEIVFVSEVSLLERILS